MLKKTGTLTVFLITIVFFLSNSCDQEKQQYKGSIVISSEFNFDNSTLVGYNFELEQNVVYPSPNDILPDIIVDQFRLLDGSLKPGFSSPSNPYGYHKMGHFENIEDSRAFYESLANADTSLSFSASSDTIEKFQVWILKTASANYTKLHVQDIQQVDDTYGLHLEIFLDYNFQQDGTTGFQK